jgi:hypothetical protein
MFRLKSKLAFFGVSLLIILIISACASATSTTSRGIYTIDPTFSDFYREFGGEVLLGSAISPSFNKNGVTYQYVVSGLMAYNPNLNPLKRYFFSAIAASEWQINGQVEPAPQGFDPHYVNGHQIWDEVLSYYDQYGSDILGLPLTGVTVNDAKQRYEQYFEGLGFYRNFSDPAGQIHLMPYGDWMCGSNCKYASADPIPPEASYVQENTATEQLFLQAAARLGYGFTGEPLTAPRLGSDGNYQMVFENVVLYIDPANGHKIRLRPIPSWLGIRSEQLKEPVDANWLSFYPITDGKGFNIPKTFSDYLSVHGAVEYSGEPISEYRGLGDGGYSQCFRNVCLEFHPSAPQGLQVRPHALGADYLTIGTKSNTADSTLNDALQIKAWEESPLIPSGEKQVIYVEATKNNEPVSGIQVSLLVTQPDGITKTYTLEPTGADGRTSIELDPIDGANGSIVQYQVCVLGAVSPQLCFSQSYTIWDAQ